MVMQLMMQNLIMAELFQTTPHNITIHLKNIFDEGELKGEVTCKDFLQVKNEMYCFVLTA
jgi:hypothetical protein